MTDAREALVAVLWEKFGAWPNGPLAAWLTKADCARFADAILAEFDVTESGPVARGLAQSAAGDVLDLGDFTQYAAPTVGEERGRDE